MMMEAFDNRFPDIADKETRCIVVVSATYGLPEGEYFLIESYCNDPECDCRRVFINVLHNKKMLATIGYGWENISFYEQWIGEKTLAKDMKGPILEIGGFSTAHSKKLLSLFKETMLKDTVFIDRLKKHYDLFKKKRGDHKKIAEEKKPFTSEDFENVDPESRTVLSLCKGKGTGIDTIHETTREAFYPLLMGVEETIWAKYLDDTSLKDSEVIESLKTVRDNIFMEDAAFSELEKKIITKIKLVLFANHYDRRDVSLSISCVLKSAKLHKSLSGSRGYLDFISVFFNEMREKGNNGKRFGKMGI